MTQTTDAALVERLRAVSRQMREHNPGRGGFNPVMPHEHTLDQAADTIEAQARRIEALEDKRAWAEHFALMIDPTRNLAINPLYYGDPAWRWAEYSMRFILKTPTP